MNSASNSSSSNLPEGDATGCPQCGQPVTIQASGPAEEFPCPHCGHLLWFLGKRLDGVVILTFLPGLITGQESIERVDEVVAATGDAPRVLLDFSLLRFLSSLFLGMLIRLHLRMASAQRALKVCGLRSEAREVFRVTRLDQVFDLCTDQQSALDSF